MEIKNSPVIFTLDQAEKRLIQYPKRAPMNWNAIFGVACIVSLVVPVAVIIYHRYYQHRSLAALLIYYTVTIIYLLMAQMIIPVSADIRTNYGVFTNYLDVPLMLAALIFFCPNKQKQHIVRLVGYGFIAYEVLITLIYGFKTIAVVYIMAPGFAIILGYALFLFVRQAKFGIMHAKNYARMIMLASILFSYGCYSLVYYFYYIQQTPNVHDTEILYFISTFISAIVMSIGLQLMNKRLKELKSLQTTRKELALFFNH